MNALNLSKLLIYYNLKMFWLLLFRIDTFLSSDQSHCASKLLSAYREADDEEIKRVAKSSTISNLDHMVNR